MQCAINSSVDKVRDITLSGKSCALGTHQRLSALQSIQNAQWRAEPKRTPVPGMLSAKGFTDAFLWELDSWTV